MGKTHEALRRAEEQYREHLVRSSPPSFPEEMATTLGQVSVGKDTNRYEDLKKNLFTRSTDRPIKSVLFINTFSRDGSTNHAIGFATSLAKDSKLNVLLVDLNLWTLSPQEVFRIDHALGLSDLFADTGTIASPIERVDPGDLYTVRLGGGHSRSSGLFESGDFDQFLKTIRNRFDYVILDAPAMASFGECRVLCSKVDAVVLVLKSGEITGQIALMAKKQFENPSHKLLGVVIDRTRTYYPRFVKTMGMVIAICLVFTLGLFLGNSWLKPQWGDHLPLHHTFSAKITSELNTLEKSAAPAVVKQDAKGTVASEASSSDIPKEKGYLKTNTEGSGLLAETRQEAPPLTPETVSSAREEIKTKQVKTSLLQAEIESDKGRVDEQIHDSEKAAVLTVQGKKEGALIPTEAISAAKEKIKTGQRQASLPQGEIESDTGRIDEQTHDSKEVASLSMGTEKERPLVGPKAGAEKTDKAKAKEVQVVIVKRGDTLFKIINRTYGTYDKKILRTVLRANPELRSPNEISVGQALKLPPLEGQS
jgi:Mrp family chromosome partitioning ATPase/nucleoid-associated protein YgaU